MKGTEEKRGTICVCDLHTHSTASDGQYTPRELVRLAKARGIQVMALTDHDNTDGLEEALQAGEALGLQVLRGVEFSSEDYRNLHILGYGFPAGAPALEEMTAGLKKRRDQRKYKICQFLREQGVEVDLALVEGLAKGGVIGRPHFAQALVQQGYVSNNREAFERYLDTPAFQRFDRNKPSAEQCVKAIKAAGGKASLAHPYQILLGQDGPEDLEQLVIRLAGYGLDALERFYPKHTPEQQARYLDLARRYGLQVTGGSDFHGERIKPDVELARVELDLGWLVG